MVQDPKWLLLWIIIILFMIINYIWIEMTGRFIAQEIVQNYSMDLWSTTQSVQIYFITV